MHRALSFIVLLTFTCGLAFAAGDDNPPSTPPADHDHPGEACTSEPAQSTNDMTPEQLQAWAKAAGGRVVSGSDESGPPACPSFSPCLGCAIGRCKTGSEIGATDTGETSCQLTPTAVFGCTGGKTVHLVDTFCALCPCCFDPEPCFCPNQCGNGSHLECR